MLTQRQLLDWSIFLVGTVLTSLVYFHMTHRGEYYEILSALGLLTLGSGIWVVKEHDWALNAIMVVSLGLLFGQWWFLEYGLASLLWAIHGFAP